MKEKEKKSPLFKRVVTHVAFFPVLLFFAAIVVFSFTSQFSERPPVIHAISPEVGSPGDVLVISGEYFGESRKGGEVLIAGFRPRSSSYIEWSNTRISVSLPSELGSGMVYVTTRNGKSNGSLFTNSHHIPVVLSGPAEPGAPYIEEISPTKGEVGDRVTLSGMNFGFERGMSRVFFTPISYVGKMEGKQEEEWFLPCSEIDFDYLQWGDTKITVRVPDGAASGTIFVDTDRGRSNTQYFEVLGKSGTKVLRNRRGYQVQQTVQVRVTQGSGENGLFLWLPGMYQGLQQNNVETVKEPEPYWPDYLGVNVYLLSNINRGERYNIQQTYWFDRYAVETKINGERVEIEYDRNTPLFRRYTEKNEYIPLDMELVDSLVPTIVARERNPYEKAKMIFDWVLEYLSYEDVGDQGDLKQVLERKRGNSYGYSILLTTLLRKAKIPARPLAGFVVYDDKQTARHFWTEFYLEGFGWVPLDPSLADGLTYGGFPTVEDPRSYYFGNVDSGHILVSRGVIPTSAIRPDSTLIKRRNSYSLQHFHEESFGNLQAYSSMWQNAKVIDWW